jgi:hypothetical protein
MMVTFNIEIEWKNTKLLRTTTIGCIIPNELLLRLGAVTYQLDPLLSSIVTPTHCTELLLLIYEFHNSWLPSFVRV